MEGVASLHNERCGKGAGNEGEKEMREERIKLKKAGERRNVEKKKQ